MLPPEPNVDGAGITQIGVFSCCHQLDGSTIGSDSAALTGRALFYSMFVAGPFAAGFILLLVSPKINRMLGGRA